MNSTERSRTAPTGSGSGASSILNYCPQCGVPAEILSYWSFESTDGPIEHVEIRCAVSHRFIVPTSTLRAAG